MGYLIDTDSNIVDQHDKLVFRRDILMNAYGQDARIPAVFTKRDLLKGRRDEQGEQMSTDRNRIVHGGKFISFDKQNKQNNMTANTSAGQGIANDTTNVGSHTQDVSKGGMNLSAVFSESPNRVSS